ncbi:MAG: M48 family metalloprotease, partial [Pseudomonadota bacterium]
TVAVSEGLLRRLPTRELVAVLAHETAHLRAGDLKILRLADAAGRLTRFLALVGLFLVVFTLPAATMAGLEVALWPVLLLVAAPVASDLLALKLSRTREFDADAGAAALTGDPRGLMMALDRIDTLQAGGWERLTRLPGWRWLSWIRTHPTTAERLARLRELEPEPETLWIELPDILAPPEGWPSSPPRLWWPRRM